MTLNNTRKNQQMQLETRQAQLFMDLYKTWTAKPFQLDVNEMFFLWEYEDYDDFFQKYGEYTNLEKHVIWDEVSMWLEGVGVLLKKELIDIDTLVQMQSLSGMMLVIWKKYEPLIVEFRLRHSEEFMGAFEYLFNELKAKYAEVYPSSPLLVKLEMGKYNPSLTKKPKTIQ